MMPGLTKAAPGSAPGGLGGASADQETAVAAPWQRLYFLPLPQGQGSLRPTLGSARRMGRASSSPPPALAPLPPPPWAAAGWVPPPLSTVRRGARRRASGTGAAA